MNWIKTRRRSPDDVVVQSLIDANHLRYRHILSCHWMNLDNGHELWMLHDGRDEVRFFRHFPATNTVVDVTASITGGHANSPRYLTPSAVSRWEACIDTLLNASRIDDVNGSNL